MTDVKWIDIKEFRDFGYLQELNRKFLHPLGLALAVEIDENGKGSLAGIWDCRDDREGVCFDDDQMAREKYENVQREWTRRLRRRRRTLGYSVQDPPQSDTKPTP